MASLDLKIPEPLENEEDATDKQKDYIRSLIRDVGGGSFPESTLHELGKWQASSIIDQLQSFKKELSGDKKLDLTRVRGLGDHESSRSKSRVIWVVLIVIVLLGVFWIIP